MITLERLTCFVGFGSLALIAGFGSMIQDDAHERFRQQLMLLAILSCAAAVASIAKLLRVKR